MNNFISLTEKEFNQLSPLKVGDDYKVGDMVLMDKDKTNYTLAVISRASLLVTGKDKVKCNNLVYRK